MAINFSAGFNIKAKESIDKRIILTKAEMRSELYESDGTVIAIPDNYFCLCKDDNSLYVYNSTNDPTEGETGKFRLASNRGNLWFYEHSITYSNNSFVVDHSHDVIPIPLAVGDIVVLDQDMTLNSVIYVKGTIFEIITVSSLYVGTATVRGSIVDIPQVVWGNITGDIDNQQDLLDKLSLKQDNLVSGTNIKTVNNTSLLGSGNLAVQPEIDSNNKLSADLVTDADTINKFVTATDKTAWSGKQDALNIQTAYTSKGSATKVPQITTNNLGQVTGITEVDIAKDVFWCTYGTTTYVEITQALSDGKIPCCFYSNRCYIYQFTRNDGLCYFSAWDPTLLKDYHLVVQTNDGWGLGNKEAEDKSNKVTSISNISTDTQYPSAKCVYDNLQTKVAIAQGVANANKFVVTDNNGDVVTENRVYTSYEDVSAVKGDLIQMNLDGTDRTYRVINRLDGTVVEVMTLVSSALTPSYSSGPLPSSGIYEGSEMDTYLNTTWYNTLSSEAKLAIVDKVIQQDQWVLIDSGQQLIATSNPLPFPVPVEYGYVTGLTTDAGTTVNYYIVPNGELAYVGIGLKTKTFGNQITRHVYTVGMQDVIDYVANPQISDGKLMDYNFYRMFQGNAVTPVPASESLLHKIQIRSAAYPNSVYGVNLFTFDGIFFSDYGRGNELCPTFQIDLSKIQYTKL